MFYIHSTTSGSFGPGSWFSAFRTAIVCCVLILSATLSSNVARAQLQEICNNGIDDDGDGLVDINDILDCACGQESTVASLIPNPSFEENNCIPTFPSQLSCANGWEQATAATTDYFLNVEGGLWDPAIPLPVPDGNGVAGFFVFKSVQPTGFGGEDTIPYLEFLGGCLLSPMLAGVQYTLQMDVVGSSWDGLNSNGVYYGPLDITLYGSSACPDWPLVFDGDTPQTSCPIGLDTWTVLGEVSYTADATWQTVTIQFTPTSDVQAIMIGGPCDIPDDFLVDFFVSSPYPYFWVDNLILNTSSSFGSSISSLGNICTDDLILTADFGNGEGDAYQWYAEGLALPGQTAASLEYSQLNLPAGLYQVISENPDGTCSQAEISVEEPDFVQPALTLDPGQGCAPLTVNFAVQSDPAELASQTWEFGVDGATSDDPNPSFTYTEPGFYDVTLTVVSNEGCSLTAVYSTLISVLEIPEVTFTIEPDEVCVGSPVQFTGGDVAAGICSWDFGDGEESDECPSTSHTYEEAGIYTVTLSVALPDNCPESVSGSSTITVFAAPEAAFTFGPQPADAFNPEITFSDATTGNPVSWEWQFGEGGALGISSVQNTSFSFPSLGGFYPAQLLVTNEAGCADSTTALVQIVEFFSIYIPNAFTPDGDGVNDVLQVEFTGLDESSFQIDIFDRWGGKVFSSEDPHEAWIGNRQGGEYFLPDGVYAYRVEARPQNSLETLQYEGSILLIR